MPAIKLQETLRRNIINPRFWTEQSLKRLAKSGDKVLRVGEYIKLVRLIFHLYNILSIYIPGIQTCGESVYIDYRTSGLQRNEKKENKKHLENEKKK